MRDVFGFEERRDQALLVFSYVYGTPNAYEEHISISCSVTLTLELTSRLTSPSSSAFGHKAPSNSNKPHITLSPSTLHPPTYNTNTHFTLLFETDKTPQSPPSAKNGTTRSRKGRNKGMSGLSMTPEKQTSSLRDSSSLSLHVNPITMSNTIIRLPHDSTPDLALPTSEHNQSHSKS